MNEETQRLEKELMEVSQSLESLCAIAAAAGDSPIDMTGDQLFFLLHRLKPCCSGEHLAIRLS